MDKLYNQAIGVTMPTSSIGRTSPGHPIVAYFEYIIPMVGGASV